MGKYFFYTLSLYLLSGSLFASDFKAQYEIAKVAYDNWAKDHPHTDFLKASLTAVVDTAPCIHCPAPMALASNILPILKALPNSSQYPIIGDLELQYASVSTNSIDGIKCRTLISTFDDHLELRKFDGQYKQIAEGVFDRYSSVAELTYTATNLKEVIYYYRDKSNHVVQVIVDKNGKAMFRYFEDTSRPNNMNSPSIAHTDESPNGTQEQKQKVSTEKFFSAKSNAKILAVSGSAEYEEGEVRLDGNVDTVVKIPRNLELSKFDGQVRLGNMQFAAGLRTNLKGHKAEFNLETSQGTKLAIITGEASIAGKMKQQTLTVPYAFEMDSIGVGVRGQVAGSIGSAGKQQMVVLQLLSPNETPGVPRTEYVTLTAINNEGQGIMYDLKKNYLSDKGAIFTTGVGKDSKGGSISASYSPGNNLFKETITIKARTAPGDSSVFLTYSRSWN